MRLSELSYLTEHNTKPDTTVATSVTRHCHGANDHTNYLSRFQIVGQGHNDFFLRIKESLLIHKDRPSLNKDEYSTPLYPFLIPSLPLSPAIYFLYFIIFCHNFFLTCSFNFYPLCSFNVISITLYPCYQSLSHLILNPITVSIFHENFNSDLTKYN